MSDVVKVGRDMRSESKTGNTADGAATPDGHQHGSGTDGTNVRSWDGGQTEALSADAVAGGATPTFERARTPGTAVVEADAAGRVEVPEALTDAPVVTLVMPTMNEEGSVAECIRAAQRAFDRMGIVGEILVSDSSTDRTPEIARELGATVVTPDRRGYGYAYRYAFRFVRGDYVAIADADMTYDFADLPALVSLVEAGADMAIGSRFRGTIDPGAMPPLHRYVGNPFLTWLLNRLYRLDVSDAHSGFRVLSREALDGLDLRSDGMEFASELIMAAAAAGLDVREAPIAYHRRVGEAKLESFRDGWRHVRFMTVNAPEFLFAAPGALLAVLGTVAMTLALWGIVPFGAALGTHGLVAGSLATLVGIQLLILASLCRLTGPLGRPRRLTRRALDGMTVDRGLAIGGFTVGIGLVQVASVAGRLAAGQATFVPADVVALTVLAAGLQVIFASVFAGVLARPR